MKRVLLASLVLALLTSAASAQQPPGHPQEYQTMTGRAPGDRSGWFDRMLDRVADQLDLDESQRAQFDEIAAPRRERMQEMGRRWQELRQAMRDGDEERAAALRAEREPAHRSGGMFTGLLDEVEPLLREDQFERLQAMRNRTQERRQQAETYRRIMTELPEELGLDDAQREEWDELIASRREQRRERWETMRPIWEQMRAAQEAGDQERLEELRKQLEEMRPDSQGMLSTFFDQLESILRDDQLSILDKYRQELVVGEQEEPLRPGDVRNILRAVKRLRLSAEQREAVKSIEREAGKARREIDRRDTAARDQLAATVKQRILKILDPEQAREFEEHLKRLDRDVRRSRGSEPARRP